MTALLKRPWPLFLLLGLASVAGYAAFAGRAGGAGFPLDDAWIHQTYARNLATRGEWSFVPGERSGGSTSPLWTLVLAGAYWAELDYWLWTIALGGVLLGLAAWLAYRLLLQLWPEQRGVATAAGVFIALEWHLAWAAASGMETILFIALALASLLLAARTSRTSAALAGLAVGAAVWARPDGLTLLPAAAAAVLLGHNGRRRARLLLMGAGFLAAGAPYVLLNLSLSGAVWPNTFFAKQAEYAALRETSLASRLVRMSSPPLTGALVLLLPGVLPVLLKRYWPGLIPLAWGVAYLAAYALRLPAAYQHGRYVMPAIPVLAVVGLGGLAGVVRRLRDPCIARRVASRAWALATLVTLLAFWLIGARRFAKDVNIINTEMVATARWVAHHTAPDDLVAAHDIGALGYFGQRKLVDLAGLISPEVIPFIRDERRLSVYLRAAGAGYLVTFPGWYPSLLADPRWRRVFTTGAPYALADGGENMAVYVWAPPD